MSDPKTEIGALVSKNPFPSLVLIIAPERIRRDRIRAYLLSEIEKRSGSSISSIKKSGKHVTLQALQQIREDLSTPSLFQSASTAVIEDAHELTAELQKEICAMAEKLPLGSSLIVLAEKLAATSSLRKAAKNSTVELKELKGVEFRKWVKKECLTSGFKTVSEQCVQAIIDISEGSPDEASRIIQHLSLYTDTDLLTLKDLETLFPSATHSSEFELLDAALSGNRKKVLFDIRNLLKQGKSPFMLLGLLGKGLGTTISIKSHLDAGNSQAATRGALNIAPWIFSKMLPSAQRYSLQSRISHSGALLKADSKLKNLSLGDETILDEFLFSLNGGENQK